MTEDMTIIAEEAYLAAKEILEKARLEQGELFVVGCSTSEVGGATIGTYSSPELAEMVFGSYEGKSLEELKDDPEFGRWLADSHHQKPPEGESGEEFLIRIQAAVAAMIDYMAQNEIFEAAVVTHGGVIATLMSTLGLPRQPLQFWKTSGGRGFTCFVHPQIWQNDHLMEVAGILPHGAATACDNGTEKKG